VALSNGYFKEEGLAIELTNGNGGVSHIVANVPLLENEKTPLSLYGKI
jgi:hypothetical protein